MTSGTNRLLLSNFSEKLPAQVGTYILFFYSPMPRCVVIGRLGDMNVQRGYYLYVGSAFGPGGLRARVRHHSGFHDKPHWHMDYLRPVLDLLEVWYCADAVKYETQWALLLDRSNITEIAMRGFGASDHSGESHLFFTKRNEVPSLFQHMLTTHRGGRLERMST